MKHADSSYLHSVSDLEHALFLSLSIFWRIESSFLSLEFSVFLSLQTVYGLCGAVKRHAFEGVPQNLTREV